MVKGVKQLDIESDLIMPVQNYTEDNYTKGHREGYREGHQEGYREGHQEGVSDGFYGGVYDGVMTTVGIAFTGALLGAAIIFINKTI